MAMFLAGTRFSWNEFKEAFRAHHIPTGIIRRKLIEFLALKQGNNTVMQYAQLSTLYLSTLAITWTMMRRSKLASSRGLAACSKTAWQYLNSTPLVSWSMGLLFRRMPTWHTRQKRKAPAVGSSSSTQQRYRLVQSGP